MKDKIIEITYWKGINLGSRRKEWMKKNLRLEEIDEGERRDKLIDIFERYDLERDDFYDMEEFDRLIDEILYFNLHQERG